MHEPLVPMLFPSLGAHISGAEFQYPDSSWKELCGQMANLVAESSGNKGQMSLLVEAILFPSCVRRGRDYHRAQNKRVGIRADAFHGSWR